MTRGHLKLFLVLLSISLTFAPAAFAQTVSTSVDVNLAGVLTSDAQGPTSATDASSFLDPLGVALMLDPGRDGYGRASQNLNGVGAVACEGLFNNSDPTNSIVSNTLWTKTATNGTAGPVNYVFNFLIAPPALRLADFLGVDAATANAPDVEFHLEIRSNSVVVFSATATMVGGVNGHSLTESGTSMSPVFVAETADVFGYNFSSFSDTIDLGVFSSGQSVTVEYQMTTEVVSGGFETGGRAAVGDPFDLSGVPGFDGELVENGAVPVGDASFGAVKTRY